MLVRLPIVLAPAMLLSALLSVGGCTSYAPPKLTVTRAYVAQESDAGVVVAFNLDATNTNSIELPLREVRYTLLINGEPVFYGVRSPEATLRRLGTQPISFPAVIRVDPGHPRPTGAAHYDIDGTLTYSTPGQLADVLFDLKFRRPKVSFHESGTVDLGTGAPPAIIQAP
jgi:hypothetical protein